MMPFCNPISLPTSSVLMAKPISASLYSSRQERKSVFSTNHIDLSNLCEPSLTQCSCMYTICQQAPFYAVVYLTQHCPSIFAHSMCKSTNGSPFNFDRLGGSQLIAMFRTPFLFLFLFAITAAGVVPCDCPKSLPYIIHSADYIFLLVF